LSTRDPSPYSGIDRGDEAVRQLVRTVRCPLPRLLAPLHPWSLQTAFRPWILPTRFWCETAVA